MSTTEHDIVSDNQAILDHLTGKPLDSETARRIHARAERITEEIRRTHGIKDTAVSLIRHAREGE